MTKREWEACFEPAPQSFSNAVRQALATKEEKQVKRFVPRAAIIALALVIAMSGAVLAASGGLFGFLHTNRIGEVQITKPQFIPYYDEENLPFCVEVTEAICDGQSAHVLITYTSDSNALVMGGEREREDLPYWRERETYDHVIEVGSIMKSVESEGSVYEVWDNRQWEYLSAQSSTMDSSIMLSNISVGDELIMHMEAWYAEDGGDAVYLPFDIVISTQQANTKTYEAVNLPLKMENYVVKAAGVTRTDMACYVTLEVEDAYDQAEYDASFVETEDGEISMLMLPLHGSYWFYVLDEGGEALPLQQGDWNTLESDNEEWIHMLVTEAVPAFEVKSTLILLPYDSHEKLTYEPIRLELAEQDSGK